MMTRHLKRCCPGLAEWLWTVLLLCLPALAPRADTGISPLSPDDCLPLDAEVVLNQRRLPDLYALCQVGTAILIAPRVLATMGFSAAGVPAGEPDRPVPVTSLPGVTARYDALAVRLFLTAPAGLLRAQRYQVGQSKQPVALSGPALPGVILNYSLYTSRVADETIASSWSEWRVTGGERWSFSDSQRAVWQSTGEQRFVHLDTRLQRDFPAHALTLTLGDSTTVVPDWQRATRMMGVQLASNFALQPQSGTAPDALLLGQVALPSTVDVYINRVRQSSQQVSPGPFDIAGMPVRNGVNSIQMVTTDVTGKQQVRSYSLYGAASLLKAGLSDVSVSTGVTRRSWGVKDWETGSHPVFSAGLRHGLTDTLTLEGYAEGGHRAQVGGLGAQWVPYSQAGLFNMAVARSRGDASAGTQVTWGWQRNSGPFSLSLGEQRAMGGYRDIAAWEGVPLPHRRRQLFTSMSTPVGTPALGLIDQDEADGQRRRYASLSWSWAWHGGSLNVTLNREAGARRAQSLALWLTVPLGADNRLSLSQTTTRHDSSVTTDVSGGRDGLNWRVSQGRVSGRQGTAAAEMSRRTAYGDLSAGIGQVHAPQATTSLYASASGSAALLPQGVFLTRQVGDGFGLVSTGGVPDIPVRLENNAVGVTDRNGYLFLNNLQPWQANLVSLDAASISDRWLLGRTSQSVVPARQSGVLAAFDVRRNASVELSLTRPAGDVIPVGSVVHVAGVFLTQVGHDGLVWLAESHSGEVLDVSDDAGNWRCRVVLTSALIAQAQRAPVTQVCLPEIR